jgi:hypothetical protein
MENETKRLVEELKQAEKLRLVAAFESFGFRAFPVKEGVRVYIEKQASTIIEPCGEQWEKFRKAIYDALDFSKT